MLLKEEPPKLTLRMKEEMRQNTEVASAGPKFRDFPGLILAPGPLSVLLPHGLPAAVGGNNSRTLKRFEWISVMKLALIT
jgi:hypothetical protein